jgi:hypothetical protein
VCCGTALHFNNHTYVSSLEGFECLTLTKEQTRMKAAEMRFLGVLGEYRMTDYESNENVKE